MMMMMMMIMISLINFDGYTQCTVSGTNFVYSFSLLRNWIMQSYSATISCSRIISWVPHGVLTPKGFNV